MRAIETSLFCEQLSVEIMSLFCRRRNSHIRSIRSVGKIGRNRESQLLTRSHAAEGSAIGHKWSRDKKRLQLMSEERRHWCRKSVLEWRYVCETCLTVHQDVREAIDHLTLFEWKWKITLMSGWDKKDKSGIQTKLQRIKSWSWMTCVSSSCGSVDSLLFHAFLVSNSILSFLAEICQTYPKTRWRLQSSSILRSYRYEQQTRE
jgi:hypothetical protein